MKKILPAILLALLFILTASSVGYAADIQMKVDGVTILAEVKPEMKNNRMMVPLRVISENVGANVHWSGTEVALTKNDRKIVLTLNSDKAVFNGKTVLLDAKPYLKDNRLFVPLRFLAQSFGCTVNYSHTTVSVDTKPFYIDGVQVAAVQEEIQMTMGSIVDELQGHAYIETMYNLLMQNKGNEVEAPARISLNVHNRLPGDYDQVVQIDFVGENGDSITSFGLYAEVPSEGEDEGEPKVVIYAETEKRWYAFSSKASQEIWELNAIAGKNGFLTMISNTTP
ncbi:copper amine oxidase N-terminal domain-containing protein [Paenibacillus methanolicus]|uniref:Copper amine oxidase-like protein n=1 Tax=Paenibacillus methanolicus TaxID=582686 RepID=A0A5S5C0W5_9BACL|nr:copper amine oxidase N-terminal domain-containing protein [Paenibacillus methanolicus]TYP72086.1 copper amine oxidase-like protein [Paenibacillus methanolicus]